MIDDREGDQDDEGDQLVATGAGRHGQEMPRRVRGQTTAPPVGLEHVLVSAVERNPQLPHRGAACRSGSPTSTSSWPRACASGRPTWGAGSWRGPPRATRRRPSRPRGAPAQEMGVATIGLPEAAGGGGGSVLDVAVALEACAHELVPGPLLGPAVASLVAPRGARRTRSSASGSSDVVWDLPSATHVLLADADGSWSLYPRDAVEATASLGLDLSRRFGTARVVDESAGRRRTRPDDRAGCVVRRSRWPPRRPPASRAGAWRPRSSTRRCASSSARRSAPSRRSSTCAPRCWRPPRR